MDMVGHDMLFFHLAFLLPGQLPEDETKLLADHFK